MIEVKVLHLALDEKNQFPVVILETLDRAKRLPIWIGPPEANAIAMELQKKRFQRPLTHDLIIAMFTGCGIKLPRVEIVDLRENTFFAKIYLEKDGELIAVDARPSDSLALALKAKAKVFVHPKLFTDELDRLVQPEPDEALLSEEERAERLKKFLEGISPTDFGRLEF
ncbi:MAG: bifunctional nuclease family protein [Candidatus Eisenbacteria bacterium]|uniref:Bifunctional nuclease family protein n=1 Tax=Eiseniibacteriota bacterium TaxID=2212470 RepID=A0A956N8C4_UNCEI|nr:bifunctional nuclease family protein [Candidatus Eisenbacteria bacterium]MCB9463070.1 bifunctional nuclease family protein [Candidatus Eisenbacteria bacterium]